MRRNSPFRLRNVHRDLRILKSALGSTNLLKGVTGELNTLRTLREDPLSEISAILGEANAAVAWPAMLRTYGHLAGLGVVLGQVIDPDILIPEGDLADERWFYVNGILTDPRMIQCHCDRLFEDFHRPVTALYNPTHGLALDTLEVVLGRSLNVTSRPASRVLAAVRAELLNHAVTRVLVIAHSQGAIITANALAGLWRDPACQPVLDKLEVYTFGGATDEMQTRADPGSQEVPHVEHYANHGDFVAHLGVLQDYGGQLGGHVYTRRGLGHFLNAHYLPYLEAYSAERSGSPQPRLREYLAGGRPPAPSR